MRTERLKQMCSMFDNEQRLSVTDKILLYVEMFTYEETKPFVRQPLLDLQTRLIDTRDYEALSVMKEALRNVGVEFTYERPRPVVRKPVARKTFYTDDQNVHALAKGTEVVASKIVKEFPDVYARPVEFSDARFDHFFETIENLSYHAFEPKNLFASVFKCISSIHIEETRTSMIERLKEELTESDGMCLSGCVIRLVNALRGFGFTDFETTLDEYEHERSKVFYLITKAVENTSIAFENPTALVAKVEQLVNSEAITLSKLHGKRILEAYTGVKWTRTRDKYYGYNSLPRDR